MTSSSTPLIAISDALEKLNKISDEWIQLHADSTKLPWYPSYDQLWQSYSRVVTLSTHISNRLGFVNEDLSNAFKTSSASTSDGTAYLGQDVAVDEVINGAADHAQCTRSSLFIECCQRVPPPNSPENTLESMRIPDLLLEPFDHFPVLSQISAGRHGWVFAVRHPVSTAFIKTPVFRLKHRLPSGDEVSYGIYEASRWMAADMTAPEFLKLEEEVQTAIVFNTSGCTPGQEGFIYARQDFCASRLRVSCFFLRCVRSSIMTDADRVLSAIPADAYKRQKPGFWKNFLSISYDDIDNVQDSTVFPPAAVESEDDDSANLIRRNSFPNTPANSPVSPTTPGGWTPSLDSVRESNQRRISAPTSSSRDWIVR